ncbi:S8 family serine peptidase [Pantanalinema rosaneae CENA516]|uniref:S8 family serine peptidase n=1 Tax=Pantanalinema rosaneae TaxID=1620701 RepID=UPI003D6FA7D1
MTGQAPLNPTPEPAPGTTMPESSVGRVLQRGGEELLLQKVEDRFVVSTTDSDALANLVQQLPAELQPTSGLEQLTEIVVDPAQRDQVMQQVRQSEQIDYATHVYQLQNSPDSRIYLTNQITIQFAPTVPPSAIGQIALEFGLQQVKPIEGLANAFVFQSTAAATENPVKIANRLIQRSEVMVAEPNIVIPTQSYYRPKDPLYPKQWHLNHSGGTGLAANSHIFAEKAWDITRGVRSIIVAVMDDSVDLNHPDFQGVGKIVAPRDFKDNDFLPLPGEPEDNHGTACAGVAVAEENGNGSVGVAPGCALMPIRTTGYLGDEDMERLFNWAIDKGAAVISCSWGAAANYFPLSLRVSASLTRAATKGRNGKGCVIVFASGNSNRPINGTVNEQGWPNNELRGSTQWLNGFAIHPDVIAVAASTSLNRKAAYSNWGAEISVCAPSNNAPSMVPPDAYDTYAGLGIVTADRTGYEGYDPGNFTSDFGGTSSACPVVAGVAALVLSANPDLTATDVRQILQQTADKIVDQNPDPQLKLRKGTYETSGRSEWFGYGKVNAFKAVQAAVQRQAAAIAGSRQIRQANSTQVAIPDYNLQGVTSTIQITETSLVRDVQVTVAIDHSFMSDLEISLTSPSGQTILLQGRTLGVRTTLQATYSPQTTPLLKRFFNQPAQGQWKLTVVDYAQGDTGSLKTWELLLKV